jgi:hypothetical protein
LNRSDGGYAISAVVETVSAYFSKTEGLLLAAELNVPAERVRSCVTADTSGRRTTATRGNWFFAGAPALVAAYENGQRRVIDVRRQPGQVALFANRATKRPAVLLSLVARGDRLELDAHLPRPGEERGTSMASAAQFIDKIRRTRTGLLLLLPSLIADDEQRRVVGNAVIRCRWQARRTSVHGHLALAADEQRVLGILAANELGRTLFERPQLAARREQVAWLMGALPQLIARRTEALPAARRRFPPSAERTPSEPPRFAARTVQNSTQHFPFRTLSTKAQFSDATWRWLGFGLSPISVSLEIVTAPDGRSTTLRAVGDADGDGTLYVAERRLSLAPGGHVEIGPLQEATPDE